MRLVAVALMLVPVSALAGSANVTPLVPAYLSCPRPTTTTTLGSPPPCSPAERESAYRFDSALLKSSRRPYIKAGAVAFVAVLKGVRDANGQLVTTDPADPADDFAIVSPPGQTTVTFLNATFAPGVLSGPVTVPFDLKGGAAKVTYRVPDDVPIPDGIVVEGGSVTIYDNASPRRRLATVGSQSPPAQP
jgi:hypothetical protein